MSPYKKKKKKLLHQFHHITVSSKKCSAQGGGGTDSTSVPRHRFSVSWLFYCWQFLRFICRGTVADCIRLTKWYFDAEIVGESRRHFNNKYRRIFTIRNYITWEFFFLLGGESAPGSDRIKRPVVRSLVLCSAATFKITNLAAAVEDSIAIT